MSNNPGLRERKKAATRQAISDIATRLFMDRGFENVTVDEIAEKANVSRLTVFNYFPRKEDLFFDRDGQGEAEVLIRTALQRRDKGEALSASLRRLFRELIKTKHPFVRFDKGLVQFWRTVRNSASLSASAREARDESSQRLARVLAETVGRPKSDVEARFAAACLVTAWTFAYTEALCRLEFGDSPAKAEKIFASLLDRGLVGMSAALSKTPYV